MPRPTQHAAATAPIASGSAPSPLIPCLLLRHGEVCLPGENGPVPARSSDGREFDPFDVLDRLAADYPLVYLVDLDGVEKAQPQLDFLQELARDAALWVDGGVRNADQAIDILVTGARRAVLSSATLEGPTELQRAWRLSTELVFEIEIDGRGLVARPEWTTSDPLALARSVRALGPDHMVVSPREIDPDWELVRRIAEGGPTWVDGSFASSSASRLAEVGAQGGIFHLEEFLRSWPAPAPPSPTVRSRTARDDETKNRLTRDE